MEQKFLIFYYMINTRDESAKLGPAAYTSKVRQIFNELFLF